MNVGRIRELQAFQAALARVATGSGEVLLVVGEAGVGKTHLLSVLRDEALASGFEVVLGRCFGDAEQPAFAAWREAFAELSLTPPQTRLLGSLDDRARVFEAVLVELSKRVEQRPVLIAIEDLHWADSHSIGLFLHLVRFALAQRVLLLGTVRSPDLDGARNPALEAALGELARDARCQRLLLRAFTEDEVAEFGAELAGCPVPQSLVRALHAETRGNALYIRELLRHLLEEGKLTLRAGQLGTDFSVAELGLPPSLRDVVRQRARRLSEQAVLLLRVAAVASAPTELATLCEVLGVDGAGILDVLDEVLGAGLLRAEGSRYELAHAIVRRSIYEELNPERRARLHRRLAEALLVARRVDHAAIAAHYHASRSLAGADAGIAHAIEAGEAARADGAPERCSAFLEMAVDLVDPRDSERTLELLERLAVARAEATDTKGALAATEQALRVLERAGNSDRIPEVLAKVAVALETTGAPRASFEPLVAKGLAALGDLRDRTWARLSLLTRRPTPVVDGPLFVARFAGHDPEAVRLLRESGDELDVAATVEPHDVRSASELQALLQRIRSWRDQAAIIRVLDACARDVFFRGHDFRAARGHVEHLLDISERAGSLTGQGAAWVMLGCCRAVLGDIAQAQSDLERARAIALRLGSMHRMGSVGPLALECTLAYLVGGDWPALCKRFIAFSSSPVAASTPYGVVALNLGLVSAAFAGDTLEAERLFPLQLRVLGALPRQLNEWGATRDCGVAAAWHLGNTRVARSYLAFCDDEVRSVGSACWSSVEHSAARMTALLGDLERASELFAKAREGFERTGRTPSRALCDYDEALAWIRAGRGDHSRVAVLRAQALERFEALGMNAWALKVSALEPQADAPHPDGLTTREVEVLRLLADGLGNKEIAGSLFISVPTVERHIGNIYGKIGVRGRAAATAYALRKGLTQA